MPRLRTWIVAALATLAGCGDAAPTAAPAAAGPGAASDRPAAAPKVRSLAYRDGGRLRISADAPVVDGRGVAVVRAALEAEGGVRAEVRNPAEGAVLEAVCDATARPELVGESADGVAWRVPLPVP
ncbi:MAG TPA: hypothetical protein VEI02_08965 [Planctomycetota bacterium]|nr:hypothetical protein [Planctomycetota bacterium]